MDAKLMNNKIVIVAKENNRIVLSTKMLGPINKE